MVLTFSLALARSNWNLKDFLDLIILDSFKNFYLFLNLILKFNFNNIKKETKFLEGE